MIKVVSHSLGVDDAEGNRIIHTKYFKRAGIWFYLYLFLQRLLEDYIEVSDCAEKR